MEEAKIVRRLPVKFTPEQLSKFGDELADTVKRLDSLEDEKSEAAKGYKAQIDVIKLEMGTLARHIQEKREFRDVECTAAYNEPKTGKKTLYRTDDGSAAGVEDMTMDEMQFVMDFNSGSDLAVSVEMPDGTKVDLPNGLKPVIEELKRRRK